MPMISTDDCIIGIYPIENTKGEITDYDCYCYHKPSGVTGVGTMPTEASAEMAAINAVLSNEDFITWYNNTYPPTLKESVTVPETLTVEETVVETKEVRVFEIKDGIKQ